MTTYSATLQFRLTEPMLAAVIQAALDLHLPFETDGPQITVVVDSVMQAYEFGFRSKALVEKAARRASEPEVR